jgi:cation diffusion facilitator family transporter
MAASGSKTVIYAALVGNALISITKLGAAALTGSAAMLSEGIHSLVDTGNQILLLLGLKKAQKPADEKHPFGYGQEVYFWSFVVAILIFGVGAGVSISEGIKHVRHPNVIDNPLPNYIVLGLSFLFEGGAWYMALREFRKVKGRLGTLQAIRDSKDPTTFVILFEDSAAMAGILVAFLGIWMAQATGLAWLDGAASIVIGLILAVTAAWLAVETKGLLIGESAAPDVVDGVRKLAAAIPGVEHVNEVLTLHMGPTDVLVNLSVDVADEMPAGELEVAFAELESTIRERWPVVQRVSADVGRR